MGKYKNGILGAFSGKIGTVIGASWKGIDYMRSLPRESSIPPSEAQIVQRTKFTMVRKFLLGTKDLIEICYQNSHKSTAMNGAISYNLTHSVEGTFPDLQIDFKNLLISKGDLLGSWSPSAVSTEPNTIDFRWSNGPFCQMRSAEDLVLLIIYSQANESFVVLTDAETRSAGFAQISTRPEFKGDTVHCYLSFFSTELGISSTNEYLGKVTIL